MSLGSSVATGCVLHRRSFIYWVIPSKTIDTLTPKVGGKVPSHKNDSFMAEGVKRTPRFITLSLCH